VSNFKPERAQTWDTSQDTKSNPAGSADAPTATVITTDQKPKPLPAKSSATEIGTTQTTAHAKTARTNAIEGKKNNKIKQPTLFSVDNRQIARQNGRVSFG
jgi:hypothetical protein